MHNISRLAQRYLLVLACAVALAQVLLLLLPTGTGLVRLAIGTAVHFGCVLGAVWLLAESDVKLLTALKNLAHKLENGSQPEPVATTRSDELGELVKQVNKLTNRDKAVQQANTDALTGLANRRGILQKLEAAFKAQKPLALFYIDLDKFKPVNDQYGHEMGDAVLKRVAELFTSCVREGDTVARLGGDEFLILFAGLTDRKLLEERAQKMLDIINEPIWIDDLRIKLGASIGVTIAPQDGATVEELMNAGDETMYAVKKAGRNGYKFYS